MSDLVIPMWAAIIFLATWFMLAHAVWKAIKHMRDTDMIISALIQELTELDSPMIKKVRTDD